MVAQRCRLTVSDDAVTTMVQRMRSPPPHSEVTQALTRLRRHPFKLVALTSHR
jgi:hypothetical protein